MKRIFILCGILFVIFISSGTLFAANKKDDALMPESGIFVGGVDKVCEYEYKAKKLFAKGFNGNVVFRMVALPPFSNEWLVGVREANNKFNVFLLLCDGRINGKAKGKKGASKDVPVNEFSAEIDQDTVKALKDIWLNMLVKTHYPAKYKAGRDGTEYHFSMLVLGGGDLSGEVWSPANDTNTGRLVAIGDLLAEYAKADADKRKEILKKLKTKTDELQQLMKEDSSGLMSPMGGERK